jgi:Fe-S-cluster containining protein
MQLSSQDVKRLERLGYTSRNFTTLKKGFLTLKNVGGVCFFFNTKSNSCNVYANRPEGCRYYPVIYSLDDKKPTIDEAVCDKASTITKEELGKITPKLTKLIRRILNDSHAETRKQGKQEEKNERISTGQI